MYSLNQDLTAQYAQILQDSQKGLSEAVLQRAYELGHRAMSQGLSPLDLAMIHQECLDWILNHADTAPECAVKTKVAGSIFREILASFEMSYRGYRELITDLRQRTSELSDMNERLQKDMTERKNLETAKAAADMASQMKSRFLTTLSHELRTPLTAIIGYSQALIGVTGPRTQEENTFLERILSNGEDLLGQINNILDLARIEAGHMAVFSDPVSLVSILLEVKAGFELGSRVKNLELTVEVPPGSCVIKTDAAKVRQILTNLVGNAVKFTHKGGIVLRLSQDTAGFWRIDVEDTGIGIPADKRDVIFEPFVQANDGTNRRFGGTGLGLAICRCLCGILGHRLDVASEMGKGSVFSLTLGSEIPQGVVLAETSKEPN